MSREEDGPAAVAEAAHQCLELVCRQRVQPHEGLVHEDELRLVEQGRDDGQLLLHAVGVCADGLGQVLREVELVAVGPDALGTLPCPHRKDIRDEVQVLDASHVFVQVRVVRQIGQPPLAFQRVILHRDAVHRNAAAVELLDAAAALECGGLARAVVADECADLAGADVQAEVLHGRLAAVGLGQMFDVEHKVPSFVRGSAPLCP